MPLPASRAQLFNRMTAARSSVSTRACSSATNAVTCPAAIPHDVYLSVGLSVPVVVLAQSASHQWPLPGPVPLRSP
eukprot:2290927-Rhodomonas_salina.2